MAAAVHSQRQGGSSHPHASKHSGMKIVGNYLLGKTIGEGTFGKVKLAHHQLTGEKVAVKILEKHRITDVSDVQRVSREIHILKLINHPNVIRLFEVIDTPNNIYMIMEYASGGELFDYIVAHQRVNEKEARKFFEQILVGADYCHKRHIIHRDLKPENLLLDKNLNVKMVDFGLSNTMKTGGLLKTACGSPCYAAPEMIAGKEYHGPAADIWSMGVILFALLCGYLPFEDQNTSNLYRKILNADYQMPDFLSRDARDLIQKMLDTNPVTRWTVPKILTHPWFTKHRPAGYEVQNYQPLAKPEDTGGPIIIDDDTIAAMELVGFNASHVRKCLGQGKHNHVTATYFLLQEKAAKDGVTGVTELAACLTGVVDGNGRATPRPSASSRPTAAASGASGSQQPVIDGKKAGGVPGKAHLSVVTDRPASSGRAGYVVDKQFQQDMQMLVANRPGGGRAAAAAADLAAQPVRKPSRVGAQTARDAAAGEENQQPARAGGSATYRQGVKPVASNNAAAAAPRYSSPQYVRPSSRAGSARQPGAHGGGQGAVYSPAITARGPGAAGRQQQQPFSAAAGSGGGTVAGTGWIAKPPGARVSSPMAGAYGGPRSPRAAAGQGAAGGGVRATTATRKQPASGGSITARAPQGGAFNEQQQQQQGADQGGGSSTPRAVNASDKVNAHRGAFNVSATSSRAPESIMQEMQRVINLNKVNAKNVSAFCVKCEKAPIRFEMEICSIPNLNGMHVVRMKRITGDTWKYKEMCNRILPMLKL